MAISTCSHCQNHVFELREGEVSGAHYKVLFVQCAGCGTPIGVMEGFGSAALLKEQAERIKNIEQQILHISSSITHINRIVGEVANQRSY